MINKLRFDPRRKVFVSRRRIFLFVVASFLLGVFSAFFGAELIEKIAEKNIHFASRNIVHNISS